MRAKFFDLQKKLESDRDLYFGYNSATCLLSNGWPCRLRFELLDDLRHERSHASRPQPRIKATQAGQNTKIVAVTAHALEEERKEILASGCDDFIRKPLGKTEVFDALAKHLGVKFLYTKEKAAGAEELIDLRASDLQKLPPDLIRELLSAVELLDRKLCLEVVSRISGFDEKLTDHLRNMIEKLQYREILKVLDNFDSKEIR